MTQNKIERKVVSAEDLTEEDVFFYTDDDECRVEINDYDDEYEEYEEYNEPVLKSNMYNLDEKESKTLLEKIILYLSSEGFERSYTKYAEIHNRQKKVIRDNFCKKVLRKIGEVLDITISVTYDVCGFLINILNKILNSTVEILCGVAYKIIGLFVKIPGC